MIDAYAQQTQNAAFDVYETLTTREREVLHLAAEGYTSVQIGQRLCISPRTVETHKYEIMRVLGFKNTADLVRYATWLGLVSS